MSGSVNQGRLLILAASLLWSLGGVLAKEIGLGGAPLAFWRSLFAGLALLPFVPAGNRVFRPSMVPLGLAFAATMGFYLGAIKATTAANAIFLQCSSTFWTIPLAAWLLRERVDRRSLAGIALAMVGVALIVARGRDGRAGEGWGIALGLASGVGYAGIVVGLRGLRDLDSVWLAAFNNIVAAAALGLWVGASSGTIPLPEPREWPILVAFGIVQLAIPYALFARGLRSVQAPEAALITLLEPVLNPLWVWLRHGERPADASMVGGMFLLAGMAIRYWPARVAPPEPTPIEADQGGP
jgi:drug/metabolite transporter (DMT)-like permease